MCELVKTMANDVAADNIKSVPMSNNTIVRRIAGMTDDIVNQVVHLIKVAGCFALPLDESTDISGEFHLIALVRFPTDNDIRENILFCRQQPEHTSGEAILGVINNFFNEHNIDWTM